MVTVWLGMSEKRPKSSLRAQCHEATHRNEGSLPATQLGPPGLELELLTPTQHLSTDMTFL